MSSNAEMTYDVQDFEQYMLECMQKYRKEHLPSGHHIAIAYRITGGDKTLGRVSTRKSATPRHPDCPKKPKSSYIQYMMERKKKGEKIDVKKIAEDWNALSSRAKAKYDKAYKADTKTYKAELKAFYNEHPDQQPAPKQPVGPRSKYNLFTQNYREKHKKDLDKIASKPVTERKELRKKFNQKMSAAWKACKEDSDAMSELQELEQKDRERYAAELEDFKDAHPDIEITPKNSPRKTKSSGKPKNPMNPYTAYLATVRGQGKTAEERKEEWADIKDDEKEYSKYKEIADEDNERYVREVEIYNETHEDDQIVLSARGTPKKSPKKSPKKNSDIPSKPLNAYICFMKDMKNADARENIFDSLGMDDDTKNRDAWKVVKEYPVFMNRYITLANKSIEDYNKLVEEYNEEHEDQLSPRKMIDYLPVDESDENSSDSEYED